MRWKVFLFGLLSIWFTNQALGQTSVLRIQSADSIYFQVELQGFPSSDSSNFVFDFVFDSVTTVFGTLYLQLDSTVQVGFEADLSPGFIDIYEISKIGDQYIALPFLKTPYILDSIEADSIVPLQYDALLNNTSMFVPSRIGCSPPTANFEAIISEITTENFSFRKEKLITKILMNNCFRVDQLFTMLEQVEYEDKRIEFIELAYQHTYDLNNFQKLKSLFLLDKFQRLFDDFIQKKEVE